VPRRRFARCRLCADKDGGGGGACVHVASRVVNPGDEIGGLGCKKRNRSHKNTRHEQHHTPHDKSNTPTAVRRETGHVHEHTTHKQHHTTHDKNKNNTPTAARRETGHTQTHNTNTQTTTRRVNPRSVRPRRQSSGAHGR